MENIAIILPSAGLGSRLNLSYPKELYEVVEGVKLIDFSLSHINAFIEKMIKTDNLNFNLLIIVVVRKGKESVFEYVLDYYYRKYSKYFGTFVKVQQVYYIERLFEWAGSVYSAKKSFLDYNVVLLPDSFIKFSDSSIYHNKDSLTLIEKHISMLKTGSVSLSVLKEYGERLRDLGACYYEDGVVTQFQDKPKYKLSKYNSFWTSYSFRYGVGKELYKFLVNNIMHNMNTYDKEIFYPMKAFEVDSYFDLGTYSSIEKFKDFFKGEIQKEFFQYI